MNTHNSLSVTDDTGVSAKHLPMLGCHGFVQALYDETWSSLCFHANATATECKL